jgi:hypothetical protein
VKCRRVARVFGDCAVVIGTHDQQAAYRGQPNNGQFRATHILVREDGAWRLAGMHLSPRSVPAGGTTADRVIVTRPGEYAANRPR